MHRLSEAAAVLQSLWNDGALTPPQKLRVGMLLSDVRLAQKDLPGAREWAYSALAALEENGPIVARFRQLDQAAKGAPLPARPPAAGRR